MSEALNTLLADLARYLDQQQRAGSVFFLDEGEPAENVSPAVRPERESGSAAAPSAADPPPRPASASTPSTPAPEPGQAHDREFERECAAFVRDTLELVARTRAHAPVAASPPAQTGMFEETRPEPVQQPAPPSTLAEKAAALAAIADEVQACTACLLHGSRHLAVPGAGHADAGLVLVGEAPGQEEDRQGLPFVGRSGQLLTDILKAIGFARDEVFICNILKCRPPGNRDPERDEVAACETFLRRQLAVIRPRLILCLGRVAAQTLLGTTAPLGSLRRSVHFFAGVPVMATYHPAALLRNPANKRLTWDDVRKLRALYDALGVAGDERA